LLLLAGCQGHTRLPLLPQHERALSRTHTARTCDSRPSASAAAPWAGSASVSSRRRGRPCVQAQADVCMCRCV
jgi:hypothetical protein